MSRTQTIRRVIALLLRLTAITFLLLISASGAGLYAVGLTHPYVQIFGQNVVAETSAYFMVQQNALILIYSTGWNGTHAKTGA